VAQKQTDVERLASQLQQLHKKLRYVESRTTILNNAAVKLANGIQLLARASGDNRDLK
jgi:prefoldin subunit 5